MLQADGIPRPASDLDWATNDVRGRVTLPNGITYFKHGTGCRFDGPGCRVDFDFGQEGQIDGFDVDRLCDFFRRNKPVKYGFKSGDEIESAVQSALEAGELVHSGRGLLYLSACAGSAGDDAVINL